MGWSICEFGIAMEYLKIARVSHGTLNRIWMIILIIVGADDKGISVPTGCSAICHIHIPKPFILHRTIRMVTPQATLACQSCHCTSSYMFPSFPTLARCFTSRCFLVCLLYLCFLFVSGNMEVSTPMLFPQFPAAPCESPVYTSVTSFKLQFNSICHVFLMNAIENKIK